MLFFETRIWETVGTSEGFVGCINRLKVGRRPIEFDEKDPLISSFHEVSQCPVVSLSHRMTTTPMYVPNEPDEYLQGINNIKEKSHGQHSRHGLASSSSTSLHTNFNNFTYTHDSGKGSVFGSGHHAHGNPCLNKNPCQNNGLCWVDHGSSSGYKCVCHPLDSGELPVYCSFKVFLLLPCFTLHNTIYLSISLIQDHTAKRKKILSGKPGQC